MQEDSVTGLGGDPRAALRVIADDPSSRKRFLKMVGGAGAAGALGILIAACGQEEEQTTVAGDNAPEGGSGDSSSGGDVDIVNYALTLELLEEDFYDQVLDSGEIKSKPLLELTKRVYENEKEHVIALTSVSEQLAGNPPPAPKTDFKSVLEGGEPEILKASAMIENLGASAYLGQADKIQSPEILSSALAIHTVEARHAARFNELAGNGFSTGDELRGSVPDGAFAKPMSMEEVLERVQPFVVS